MRKGHIFRVFASMALIAGALTAFAGAAEYKIAPSSVEVRSKDVEYDRIPDIGIKKAEDIVSSSPVKFARVTMVSEGSPHWAYGRMVPCYVVPQGTVISPGTLAQADSIGTSKFTGKKSNGVPTVTFTYKIMNEFYDENYKVNLPITLTENDTIYGMGFDTELSYKGTDETYFGSLDYSFWVMDQEDFDKFTGESAMPVDTSKSSSWADDELGYGTSYDILPAFLGTIDITQPATRAQMAEQSVTLYEGISGAAEAAPESNPFTDTDNEYAIKGEALGLINGVGNGLFVPDTMVTRETAATIMARIYEKLSGKTAEAGSVQLFADDSQISDWAKGAVYQMAALDIIKGVGDNQFSPKSNVSVEQFEAMCIRICKKLKSTAH